MYQKLENETDIRNIESRILRVIEPFEALIHL